MREESRPGARRPTERRLCNSLTKIPKTGRRASLASRGHLSPLLRAMPARLGPSAALVHVRAQRLCLYIMSTSSSYMASAS